MTRLLRTALRVADLPTLIRHRTEWAAKSSPIALEMAGIYAAEIARRNSK